MDELARLSMHTSVSNSILHVINPPLSCSHAKFQSSRGSVDGETGNKHALGADHMAAEHVRVSE